MYSNEGAARIVLRQIVRIYAFGWLWVNVDSAGRWCFRFHPLGTITPVSSRWQPAARSSRERNALIERTVSAYEQIYHIEPIGS